MSVNGIEIEVGQKWRTRCGEIVTVTGYNEGLNPYPFILDNGLQHVTKHGRILVVDENHYDLVALCKELWYPDDSGEWIEVSDDKMTPPNLGTGTKVVVLASIARDEKSGHSDELQYDHWIWDRDPSHPARIVAYKIVKASQTPSAPDLLTKAEDHMRERAANYDTPQGERSMARTVAVFNAHHDTQLTEAQGWHFMQILKDVRLFTAQQYHADSAEDGIAYCALKSEAKAKEGVK